MYSIIHTPRMVGNVQNIYSGPQSGCGVRVGGVTTQCVETLPHARCCGMQDSFTSQKVKRVINGKGLTLLERVNMVKGHRVDM